MLFAYSNHPITATMPNNTTGLITVLTIQNAAPIATSNASAIITSSIGLAVVGSITCSFVLLYVLVVASTCTNVNKYFGARALVTGCVTNFLVLHINDINVINSLIKHTTPRLCNFIGHSIKIFYPLSLNDYCIS